MGSFTFFLGQAERPDGSFVFAGFTYGDFDGNVAFSGSTTDFIAVALDKDGKELWRWQVRISGCVTVRVVGQCRMACRTVPCHES